jgi:hypothetical protein
MSRSAVRRVSAAADRLVYRVERWTGIRWAQPAHPPGSGGGPAPEAALLQTRADVVHDLVQRLADLCAGLEGRPVQAVPRLDHDLALPDQLTVMVADLKLAGAGEEVLRAAAADIDATAARL